MTHVFMTKGEKQIIESVVDENKFWLYGDKQVCFKEDTIMMMLLAIRKKHGYFKIGTPQRDPLPENTLERIQ